ncbi:hypothetical protein DFA_07416 [Cavenderia fasciculata]|uniref:Uncharacterized protein n=1 Tax=Cavenderia fasciculata TaxID=261658 RepID=F4PWC9_CACFS|nr:uncharacterized protein DFA_07416 [Cavenderia fasciculata]EGG20293.1 hypothetical protein DFA_07416 [Cavenderia fasciculata]|eukprot:XP_004367276.1 hypothetical protein DFA_07416 [Cavenderia fasciculata]
MGRMSNALAMTMNQSLDTQAAPSADILVFVIKDERGRAEICFSKPASGFETLNFIINFITSTSLISKYGWHPPSRFLFLVCCGLCDHFNGWRQVLLAFKRKDKKS